MKKGTTDFTRLQTLKREVREARRPVYVADIIVSRLIEVEAGLSVAVGLFRELETDKASPYLKYGRRLSKALDTVRAALYLRNPGLYA